VGKRRRGDEKEGSCSVGGKDADTLIKSALKIKKGNIREWISRKIDQRNCTEIG
jgi:hypothetical protein